MVDIHYHHSPLNYIGLAIIFISTFSLIWGPMGIMGLSIGQLIYGGVFYIYSHFSYDVFITYMISYPLITLGMGSFIYKLYYGFNFKNSLSIHLSDVNSLFKTVMAILVTNAFYIIITYSFYFGVLGTKTTKFGFFEHYFAIVYVILPFTLLFISILGLMDVNIYKPKKSKYKIFLKYLKPYSNYISDYYPKLINLLLFIFTITLIVMGLSNNEIFTNAFYNKNTLLIVLGIVILVILKPITNDVIVRKDRYIAGFTIFIVTIMFTIITSATFMYIYIISLIFGDPNTYLFSFTYDYLELIVGIVLIILSVYLSVLFLLQRYVNGPLNTISEITEVYILNKVSEEIEEGTFGTNEKSNKSLKTILNELDALSDNKYDVGTLACSFKMMIENLEVYIENFKRVTNEREKISAELLVASQIQKDMIPNIFPLFPDRLDEFGIYAIYNPVGVIGGDLYDYFLIDDDHLAIIIGDVSGKGVSASLFMVKAMTLIKDQLLLGLSPSKVFNIVNERIVVNNENKMFLTTWLGILEISSGKLTYVNAGHDHPFISHDYSDYIVFAEKPLFAIGIEDSTRYIQHETMMSENDRIILYTDGITEAVNKDNEQFSKDRLLDVLNKNKHTNIKKLILKIKDELNNFTSGVEQFDDETMLILEYKKK
ncbi:MAG: PP2C family protein-serine/threonine phosphatase [Methanobrevibacter sp.]|nr:PP2C family protein-serine/threonine phosphatase [Candidatus Methanovirga aequatorialis]